MLKRKLDYLSRITIPKPILEKLLWQAGDEIIFQIDTEHKEILLCKNNLRCYSCQAENDLVLIKNNLYLCKHCLREFANK